jgi:hypothetical protein
MKRVTAYAIAAGVLGMLIGLGADCSNVSPVVGAECAGGRALCGGQCVDIMGDTSNCGGCGIRCGAGRACRDGICLSGSFVDGGTDGGTPPYGNPGGCPIGKQLCGQECVSTASDPRHCGACNVDCSNAPNTEGGYCAASTCVANCPDSLTACGLSCVDTQNDIYNCGGCGVACPNGLCVAGSCDGAASGHVIVIGHDYATYNNSMLRVLGNSVFLLPKDAVRILAYSTLAEPSSVSAVRQAIGAAATLRGSIDWGNPNVGGNGDPIEGLEDYQYNEYLAYVDVFLVYPQLLATDAQLQNLGVNLGIALQQFVARGGIVVLLDAMSPNNAGTYQFLESAGIFTASDIRSVTGERVSMVPGAGRDSVTAGVVFPYVGQQSTVSFGLNSLDVIARDPDDRAVVIHSISP